MISKTIEVSNKIGFHARPASLLIDSAKNFKSAITISKGDISCDLKSIIGLLKMQVKMGDIITICADGEDETEAAQKIYELIENKFGEE